MSVRGTAPGAGGQPPGRDGPSGGLLGALAQQRDELAGARQPDRGLAGGPWLPPGRWWRRVPCTTHGRPETAARHRADGATCPSAATADPLRCARVRTLTRLELNRALLARQLLLERARLPLPRALERIGGIQAQYAPSMYIGLWSRLDGFERDALTRALERRSVVQATLIRSTIHLVSRRGYFPPPPPHPPGPSPTSTRPRRCASCPSGTRRSSCTRAARGSSRSATARPSSTRRRRTRSTRSSSTAGSPGRGATTTNASDSIRSAASPARGVP